MLKQRLLFSVLTLSLIASSHAVLGQDAAVVRRAKQATALLTTANGLSATAFCVHENGYFAAPLSVVQAAGNAAIRLVVNPTESNERVFEVTMDRFNVDTGLAILKPRASASCVRLDLGESGSLSETAPMLVFGYPLGRALSERGARYPSITVSSGRVAALRKDKGALEEIQLDVALAEGSGGAPVLNEKGKVVGVVANGLTGTGLAFAAPVEKLKALVAWPVITFTPTSAPFDKVTEPRELKAVLDVIGGDTAGLTLDLELQGSDGPRTLALKPNGAGTIHSVVAPLVVSHAGLERLKVAVRFSDGWMVGDLVDRELRVPGGSVKLSEIAAIQNSPKPRIALKSGRIIEGVPEAPATISLNIAGKTVTVDLTTARETVISIADVVDARQPYKLVVKKNGEFIGQVSATIELTGMPIASSAGPITARNTAAFSISPPPLASDITTVTLPAIIEKVAVGGGGRYLILLARSLRQLLVFDVNTGTITHTISLPSDNVYYAAGAHDLFVAAPDLGLLQRWSLHTMERDATVVGSTENWLSLTMGYASTGPLLAMDVAGPLYFDTETMTPMNVRRADGKPLGREVFYTNLNSSQRFNADTSPNGRLTVFGSGGTPLALFIWLNGLTATADHAGMDWPVIPSSDSALLISRSGLFSASDLKLVAAEPCKQTACVPAIAAPYVVVLPPVTSSGFTGGGGGGFTGFRGQGAAPAPAPVAGPPTRILATANRQIVASWDVPELNERANMIQLPSGFNLNSPERAVVTLPPERRVFLIPAANLLVTINPAQNQLTLRRISLNGNR